MNNQRVSAIQVACYCNSREAAKELECNGASLDGLTQTDLRMLKFTVLPETNAQWQSASQRNKPSRR